MKTYGRWAAIAAAGLLCAGDAAPQISGGDPEQLLVRIQQDLQRQDLDSARWQLESALKKYPTEPRLYNFLGALEAQQGRYEKAETAFRKAVQDAPRFTGAWLNLGRLYMANTAKDAKAGDKSLQAYQSVLKYEPGNLEAIYQSAVILQHEGFFELSLQHLARLSAEARARPQALAIRCVDHAALGESSQAAAAASQLLESPFLSEADIQGILPVLEARDQQALETTLLEGLSRRKLASPGTLRRLAILYEHQDKFAKSRALLEQAGAGKPPSAPDLLALARVSYKQRDFTGTLGYLAHARDLDPGNASIHFFFGMVAVEMDLAIDAVKSLQEAVRLNPENPWYNYAFGAVAAQGKNPGEAIPYFEKFCALRPDDPHGRLALGVTYYEAKDYESAKRELAKTADNPETSAGANYYLGRVAIVDEDLPLAAGKLEKAVAANPKYANALAELGLVYTRQKNYEQARIALDRALAVDANAYLPNLNLLIFYQRTKDPRIEAQQLRFREIQKKREEKAKSLLRMIEVRPYQ